MKKILIIDDNEVNLKVLSLMLSKSGYKTDTIVNPKCAIDEMAVNTPDLILLDISMPEIDGFKLCSLIKHDLRFRSIPVIFVTTHSDIDFMVRGFEYGAVDYITKPYNIEEIKARISTHLRMQELQNKLFEINSMLEQKVHEQVIKISDAQMAAIYALVKLSQSKEGEDKNPEKLRRYCYAITKKLSENSAYANEIDANFLKDIFHACPLYDIGKIGISKDENDPINHTLIGYETLDEVLLKYGKNAFLEMGKTLARSHHEHFDGKGFPDGLKGIEIPLPARILSVVDRYNDLTINKNISHQDVLKTIKNESGTRFDPIIVQAMFECSDQLLKLQTFEDEEIIG